MAAGRRPQKGFSSRVRPVFWTVVAFSAASGLYVAFASIFILEPLTTAQAKALDTAVMLLQLGFGTILGLLGGQLPEN